MFHAEQNSTSIWQSIDLPALPALSENLETDVCVVGAGIAGLTTAYLLLKNGYRVTVLNRGSFGQNETGHTSAHLSYVLDDRFTHLIHIHGVKGARLAYESHSDAVDLIEKIVQEENIHCDFKRVDGYLFLSPSTRSSLLEDEMEACRRIGFRDMSLEVSPRYFATLGPCIHFPRQARIHPLKYLSGLLKAIQQMKGKVFNLTSVVEFQGGENAYVTTDFGHKVTAQHIVVATNVPVNDRVKIHAKEAAYRTYVIGIDVPAGTFPDILMWDTEDPYHYVRLIESTSPGIDTVLVGGEDHRVGQKFDKGPPHEELARWARERLGVSGKISYQWSGQIIEPFDGLAFIGRNPGDKDNVYIASGDSGQGLTHGTLAGTVLRDLIQNVRNEWSDVYDPSRVSLRAMPQLVQEGFKSTLPYEEHLHVRHDSLPADMQAGEGRILKDGLREIAVFCDEDNNIHSFSAVCPHLAGPLHWNDKEKTWDCPCHGSRFACTGEVINGPALGGMKSVPTPPLSREKTKSM
ncbi:FAD-dependent oxidoreductase [Bdellovibrio sp. HCB2-146]|uniref:FAD-dependent oxidoreductase n=1 Tax=Bdellovibrio sp. HCB2-146 TaxID=3394362 RepID=UPI0039BD23EB